MAETWLLCTACRTDIAFGSKYFQCSVSTCNRARMRLVFCSVVCWDSHVATLRHRDAWAEDKIAPTRMTWERELASQSPEPVRQPLGAPRPAAPAPSTVRPSPGTGPVAQPAMARPAQPVSPPRFSTPPTGVPTTASMGARRIVGEVTSSAPSTGGMAGGGGDVHLNDIVDRDMMIVISKLKKYIKDRSGMNCSDAVAEVLSDHVRVLCDDSIRAAGRDERKTVLDRDVPRPRRG